MNVQGWNYGNDYGIDDITLTSVEFGQYNNCLATFPRADLWGKILGLITVGIKVGDVLTLEFTKTTD